MKKIIIGADHAGFDLKEAIKPYLAESGWEVVDQGTYDRSPVDYADFGGPVAMAVATGLFSRGILVCGSGVGMAILANKFPGVRAVLGLDEEMACLSRRHNDTNVLALAGRRTDEKMAAAIVKGWLATAFEGGRHQQRLDKIRQWEQKICRMQEEQP
jgi:ribose 5-phosphate isomerase B